MTGRRLIAGIIQARTGSTRLPNKALLHLHGHPIVGWVFHRVSRARLLDRVVVAIPDVAGDDALALTLRQMGADIHRGSEADVVGRFLGAAEVARATHVVRICADNPLVDGGEIDRLVEQYFLRPCDYAYNHIPRGNRYPDGLGAEIISRELLERIEREATLPSHREHLLNYVWDQAERFSIRTFDPPDLELHAPELKLDIDTMDDYLKLLLLDLRIDMNAREIVALFTGRRP